MQLKYSTRDAPTIRDFMASDAFIQGLMGPIGGGKSAGCTVKIGKLGVAQRPGPDGVRRSRFVAIRNCFDDQTEILTEKRGWVLFRELEPEDRVASLRNGSELIFETPTMHYQASYQGEMIGFDNDSMNFLVTPDHHLWTTKTTGRRREETPYRHEKAADCYGTTYWRMKRDAEWLSGVSEESEDFFEFLGFWFAEGYAGAYPRPGVKGPMEPHRRLTVTQKKSIPYVRDLLARADLKYGEYINAENGCINFVMRQTDRVKALTDESALCGKAKTKSIPNWVKSAPAGHLRAFIRGYIAGDGHEKTCPRDSTRGFTASRKMADDLQEIALRAGSAANVSTVLSSGIGWSKLGVSYVVTFAQPLRYRPVTNRGWYKQQYDGMVYCVEVPTHVVYVRRNGKALWCGQSYRQLADTTIKTFHQWFPPHIMGEWRPSEDRYIIKALRAADNEPNAEIEVLFRALDRPDQVGNLLSLELTGGWVNEAREVPWTIIEALQGRVGRYPAMKDGGASWSGIMMDTNPPDADSKWYRFFEEEDHSEAIEALARVIPGMTRDKFARIYKQPSGLAPNAENIAHLLPGYYQRAAIGKSDEWVKVYIHGQYGFTVDGKPVFPEYNDTLHCPDDPKKQPMTDPKLPVYRSWDFGLTPACAFSQVTTSGQWVVVDELVSDSMGIDRFSDEVLEHSARYFPDTDFIDIGDPAGAQRAQTDEKTCFQILWAKGIQIEPGLQDPTIRQECVRKPLRTLVSGKPQFALHPRCRVLRKGFMGAYAFRRMQVSGERYTSVPDKNEASHIHDALQYAATRIFSGGLVRRKPRDVDYEEPAIANRTRSVTTGY